MQGAFYERLIISPEVASRSRGSPGSWKWSNGNKTLTLNLAQGAKWSDGKPLTSADVVYSLTAGQQDKVMDRIGLTGAGNEHRLGQGEGPVQGRRSTLKTADSQFIAAKLNRAVRRA